ncbi:hypothetical protein G7Y89_g3772 [Cudoniella acicularis]|uniref:Uncharacterized protein n=1 Tax=Cudoniella acicularis TaxID=354080 RepID=A0A8H4RS29_9HELO|nr:hypothetical protein G7Y89_g3772 [Cudoniella acicularis]
MNPVPMPMSHPAMGHQSSGPASISSPMTVLAQAQAQAQAQEPAPNIRNSAGMPRTFYQVPPYAAAVFSTKNGTRPKRILEEPYPLLIARSNLEKEVTDKAEILREQFPTVVRSIVQPKKWEDLYQFFDGYDLWVESPSFCFYVIDVIARKNRMLATQFTQEINAYAAQWVEYHRETVLSTPPSTDLLTLFQGEEKNGLQIMTDGEIQALRVALDQQRRSLNEAMIRTRPIQHLYPVAEGFPAIPHPYVPQPSAMIPPQDLHRGQIVPLQVPTHQNFTNFMQSQSQRHLVSGIPHVSATNSIHREGWNMQGESRPRGMSNDSTRNALAPHRANNRYNQNGRRTVSSTPRTSPPHRPEEPPYYPNASSQRSPPKPLTSQRMASDSSNLRFPNVSNDARVPADVSMMSDNKIMIAGNGAITYFYIGERRNLDAQIMSNAGEVETITFLPRVGGLGSGATFVAFTDVESVGRAIDTLTGSVAPSGSTLDVKPARERGRERSNSQLSQSNYNQSGARSQYYQPRDFGEYRPSARRQSFRNQSVSYSQFSNQSLQNGPERMADSALSPRMIGATLMSSMSELAQHNLALNRFPSQMPLNSIENIRKLPKLDTQNSRSQETTSVNKENSPMKKGTQEQTPHKAPEGNGQKRGKKKGSKQNTSARPSPSSTPVKSRSHQKLDDLKDSHGRNPGAKEEGYQTDRSAHKVTDHTERKPDSAQDKKVFFKKANTKSPIEKDSESVVNAGAARLGTNSIAVEEGSDTAMSPTDPGASSSGISSKSTATSFSNDSSERKPSIVSGISDLSSSATLKSHIPNSNQASDQTSNKPVPKPRSRNYRVKTGHDQPKDEVESNEITTFAPNSKQELQAKMETDAKIDSVDIKSSKDAQSKGNQEIVNGKEAQNIITKPDQRTQVQGQPKEDVSKSKKHGKRSSSGSTTSNGSLRKADIKAGKAVAKDTDAKKVPQVEVAKSTASSSSQSEPATPIRPQSPITEAILKDPNHWPALGPSNSPQTTIADGKRPPPIAPLLRPSAPRKTPSGTIVPAVPVIKRSRPQSRRLSQLEEQRGSSEGLNTGSESHVGGLVPMRSSASSTSVRPDFRTLTPNRYFCNAIKRLHILLFNLLEGDLVDIVEFATERHKNHGKPPKLAVNASSWWYNNMTAKQALEIRNKSRVDPHTIEANIIYYALHILRLGIQLHFVFDGPKTLSNGGKTFPGHDPPSLLLQEALGILHIPWHKAPREAEAECAAMEMEGLVDAVWSEDGNAFAFGCQNLIRFHKESTLSERERGRKSTTNFRLYTLDKIAQNHDGMDRNGFILNAILTGGGNYSYALPYFEPRDVLHAAAYGLGESLHANSLDKSAFKAWRDSQLSDYLKTVGKETNTLAKFCRWKDLQDYATPDVSSRDALLSSTRSKDVQFDEKKAYSFLEDNFQWNENQWAKLIIPLRIVQLLLATEEGQESQHDHLKLKCDLKKNPKKVKATFILANSTSLDMSVLFEKTGELETLLWVLRKANFNQQPSIHAFLSPPQSDQKGKGKEVPSASSTASSNRLRQIQNGMGKKPLSPPSASSSRTNGEGSSKRPDRTGRANTPPSPTPKQRKRRLPWPNAKMSKNIPSASKNPPADSITQECSAKGKGREIMPLPETKKKRNRSPGDSHESSDSSDGGIPEKRPKLATKKPPSTPPLEVIDLTESTDDIALTSPQSEDGQYGSFPTLPDLEMLDPSLNVTKHGNAYVGYQEIDSDSDEYGSFPSSPDVQAILLVGNKFYKVLLALSWQQPQHRSVHTALQDLLASIESFEDVIQFIERPTLELRAVPEFRSSTEEFRYFTTLRLLATLEKLTITQLKGRLLSLNFLKWHLRRTFGALDYFDVRYSTKETKEQFLGRLVCNQGETGRSINNVLAQHLEPRGDAQRADGMLNVAKRGNAAIKKEEHDLIKQEEDDGEEARLFIEQEQDEEPLLSEEESEDGLFNFVFVDRRCPPVKREPRPAIKQEGGARVLVLALIATTECSVCIEEVDNDQFRRLPITPNCNACLTCSIDTQIPSVARDQITCPLCPSLLLFSSVKDIASPDAFTTYDKKSFLAALSPMLNFTYCLNPACEDGQIHGGGEEQPIVMCTSCGFKTCFVHKVPWRAGKTCAEYNEKRRERIEQERESASYLEKETKVCPNPECGLHCVKVDGCDHMTSAGVLPEGDVLVEHGAVLRAPEIESDDDDGLEALMDDSNDDEIFL